MIRYEDIRDLVFAWGLREDIIEKDYLIGWVLWGIGSDRSGSECFLGLQRWNLSEEMFP
jgi:hypothetical protein